MWVVAVRGGGNRDLSNIDIAKQSTRGSFALVTGSVLSSVLSAVSVIIIARLLGPSSYGAYTLVLLIPSILINFLGFGVTSGITMYAAYHLGRHEPEIARRMTITGLIFLLAFGVALSAGSFVGAGLLSTYVLHRPELTPLVQFSALLVLGLSLSQSLIAVLLGWGYMGLVSLSNVLQSAIKLVVAIVLVLLGFGVFGAISGYTFAVFLSTAIVLISTIKDTLNRLRSLDCILRF